MIDPAARAVRRVLREASQGRERRRRTPPAVRFDPDAAGHATIYYLSPDHDRPSGGIRNLYRHVDLLNDDGVPAAVMHHRPGFRCGWFEHQTRIVSAEQVRLGPRDVLVVPEFYGPGLVQLPTGPRKIIFNQNAYCTFDHVPFASTGAGAPYAAVPDLVSLLTVSEDGAALLRYAFADLPVSIARVVVDGRLFHPAGRPGGRRIGYMPRRRAAEQEQVLHLLRARGVLSGWELVPIDGMSETQTAEALRGCAIFLSFSEREGFGLPPAEAMAAGCYVVGFTGLGGREFFDPHYCAPVPEADLLAFATAVEEAVNRYHTEPESLAKAGQLAAEHILSRYHEAGLRADLRALLSTLDQ